MRSSKVQHSHGFQTMPNAKPDFQETKRSGHKTAKEGESFTRSDVMTAHSLTLEKISAHGAHAEPNMIPAALVMESQQVNNKRNQPSMTSTQKMPRSMNRNLKLHQETVPRVVALYGGFQRG